MADIAGLQGSVISELVSGVRLSRRTPHEATLPLLCEPPRLSHAFRAATVRTYIVGFVLFLAEYFSWHAS